MNRDHYVVYWDSNLQQYTTTTPREWARQYGGSYNLNADARTSQIEDLLKSEFRFVEFTYDTAVVLCNLDIVTPNF